MKRFIEGVERTQSTLFPDRLKDWIGEDNPVRVVDVFVDELDLGDLGFGRVQPRATGRPSTPPSAACAQAPRPVCVNGDFRERSREFAQRFRRRRAVRDPTGSVRPPQGVLGKFRGGWPKSCDEIVPRFWPGRSDNIAARIRKSRGGVWRAGIGVVQIGPAPWPGFMFVDFSAARPARCDGEARGAAKSAVIQVIRLCDNNSREPRGQ